MAEPSEGLILLSWISDQDAQYKGLVAQLTGRLVWDKVHARQGAVSATAYMNVCNSCLHSCFLHSCHFLSCAAWTARRSWWMLHTLTCALQCTCKISCRALEMTTLWACGNVCWLCTTALVFSDPPNYKMHARGFPRRLCIMGIWGRISGNCTSPTPQHIMCSSSWRTWATNGCIIVGHQRQPNHSGTLTLMNAQASKSPHTRPTSRPQKRLAKARRATIGWQFHCTTLPKHAPMWRLLINWSAVVPHTAAEASVLFSTYMDEVFSKLDLLRSKPSELAPAPPPAFRSRAARVSLGLES